MTDLRRMREMRHSPLLNYIIPGVTSWLVGAPSPAGCVRYFHSERRHQEAIAPHSHRFDFQCLVLRGSVRNLIWEPVYSADRGDMWAISELIYSGAPGQYEKVYTKTAKRYEAKEVTYTPDTWYGMKAEQIHSIFFDRDTEVLFFEGPAVTDRTTVLEPYANGDIVETFETRPWMFQRPPKETP